MQKLSRYLEYRLAEYLRQFVNLDKYPNLVLRFNLFILESTASVGVIRDLDQISSGECPDGLRAVSGNVNVADPGRRRI